MNRQMRKRLNKDPVERAEYFYDRQLAQKTLLMIYIPLLYMRKNYGFGKKRLGDMAEGCVDILGSILSKDISFDDISDTIFEETGVRVSRGGLDLDISKEVIDENKKGLRIRG